MRSRIAPVLLALLMIGAAPRPEKPGSESFRISSASRLVLTDVLVMGADDHLVTDLAPEDLEIWVDGERQPLTFFRLVSAEPASAVGASEPAAPAAPDSRAAAFASPAAGRCVVILLDLGSMPADALGYVKQGVGEFLRAGLTPSDRIMLVSIGQGVVVHQPFTSEPQEVADALDRISPRAFGQDASSSLAQLVDRLESAVGMNPDAPNTNLLIDIGKSYIQGLESRVHHVTTCLGAVTRYLASLPGRKQLVFYSGGYPLDADVVVPEIIREVDPRIDPRDVSAGIWSAHRERLTTYFQTIIDQANRSQVSIYSIDVRGLIAQGGAGGATVRSSVSLIRRGRYNNVLRSDLQSPQQFLEGIATDTGGASYINTNDMPRVVQRALQDARAYYLVGFQPPAGGKPGKYRKMEVKVRRPGCSVSARQGYYELDDAEVVRRDFLNALKFPSLFRQFAVDAVDSLNGGRLAVHVEIPIRELEFTPVGNRNHCGLEIYGALTDKDGRLLRDRWLFARSYALDFNAGELAEFRQGNAVTSDCSVEVPPGDYQLTVIARQVESGRLATVTRAVVVAKPKK
jgi:VWFA-related protein